MGVSDYARAVIWPAGGGAIDVSAETNITTTTGAGIAIVDGVMQVVGRAEKDGRGAIAYLYIVGKLNNLGSMSRGKQSWTFDRAQGINTAGMNCGVGKVGGRKNQQLHGFLLLPIAP